MSLKDPLGLQRKKNRKKRAEYFEPQVKSDIEHRELEFFLKTATIRFNRQANYVILFTLEESFAGNYDGVMIKIDDGEYSAGHSYTSELIQPPEIGTRLPFEHTVSFILPKGYCKNDGRHDVHIRMEAWEASSNKGADVRLTKMVGQTIYPIYPRPKAPDINLDSQPGKPMLRENIVLPLLRTPNSDIKVMHCGDLAFSVTIIDRTRVTDIPMIRISSASTYVGDQTDRTDGATTAGLSKSPMPQSPVPPLVLQDQQGKRGVQNQLTFRIQGRTGSAVSGGQTAPSPVPTQASRRPRVVHSPPVNQRMQSPRTNAGGKDDDDLFPDEPILEKVPILPVGVVIKSKPHKTTEQFVSLHDIKFLKPEALAKGVGEVKDVLNEISHVSYPGTEKIDIIIHAACSLPERSKDKNLPRPFVAVSTTMGFLQNEIQSFTHVSKNPGSCATWGELCTVEFDGITIDNEALILSIVDKETLEILASYSIPVTHLKPYQQYHLELLLPRRHGINCRLYVSVMRKLPQIPQEFMGPAYGIEVLLRKFESPVSVNPGPIICVARIVPDSTRYGSSLSLSSSIFGVNPHRVTFPLPKATAFVECENHSSGNPQVSLAGDRPTQPGWNYPFLFATSRDKATMFTPGAALLLEFYQFFMQTNEADGWVLKNPVGYSLVPMDLKIFDAISKSPSTLGVSMFGIPVFSQNLKTKDGKVPTICIALRLLSPHAVDTLASQSRIIIESLPAVDIHPFLHEMNVNCKTIGYKYSSPCPNAKIFPGPPPGQTTMHLVPKNVDEVVEEYGLTVEKLPPRPPLNLQLNDGELPPATAMQSILPEYHYLLEGGRGRRTQPAHILRQTGDDAFAATRSPPPPNNILVPVNADAMAVAELDQYRRAVRRMGEDILALRREMAKMAAENTRLGHQVAHYDELSRNAISTQELESLSKPELADRYIATRQQLIQQEGELQQYKSRVQKLHNELIKKNDSEVEGAHIRQAHAAQQAIIQRLQEKADRYDKLAETVRHQELVIERMERVLTTRLKSVPDVTTVDVNSVKREAYDSVVEENTQLRRQVEEMRIISDSMGQAQSETDSERLQMMQAMDRMEARVVALEKELDDRSREWGRERAELVIKLNEQHRGFSPTRMSPPRLSPDRSGVNFQRFTVADTAAAPPTAFPALPTGLRPTMAAGSGIGRTLLGRNRIGQS